MGRARPPIAALEVHLRVRQRFRHSDASGVVRLWDVTRGLEIARFGHELMALPLAEHGFTCEWVHEFYEGLDEEYARTTDLRQPLLFIPFGRECLLIDGYHRVWRAAKLDVPELPMYLLTAEEARRVQLFGPPPPSALESE